MRRGEAGLARQVIARHGWPRPCWVGRVDQDLVGACERVHVGVDMLRHMDEARLVGATGHRLVYPIDRIRGELEATRGVELVDRVQEGDVTLLLQVVQRRVGRQCALAARHRTDQALIGGDEFLDRATVARPNSPE